MLKQKVHLLSENIKKLKNQLKNLNIGLDNFVLLFLTDIYSS